MSHVPETFGASAADGDAVMANEDIYCHSEHSDDGKPIQDDGEPQVLNPSKAKFN